jgi:hypothetical protein
MKLFLPTRRWFRFRLRTMFVMTTLVCLYLGWATNWIHQRQDFLRGAPEIYTYSNDVRAPFPLCLLGEKGLAPIYRIDHSADELDKVEKLFPECEQRFSFNISYTR